jgi:hypothetical protein
VQADIRLPFTSEQADGGAPVDLEIYRFRNGNVTLLAFLQNLPPPQKGQAADDPRAGTPHRVQLAFPRWEHLYDIRRGRALGRSEQVDLTIDPVAPTILAVTQTPLPKPVLQAPATLRRGETAILSLSLDASTPADIHVYRVDIVDPSGAPMPHYSRNLIAPAGRATMTLPIALNDAIGQWEIRVTDRLSGATVSSRLEVGDP